MSKTRMSLPLYVIQGQVTTININQNNNITGIHIPNQKNEVKISRDSNLFLKNMESVNNALTFFCTLNKAMVTTINLEKNTVLPINTEDKYKKFPQKSQLKNNLKLQKF